MGLSFWVKDSQQIVSVLSALAQTVPEVVKYSNRLLNTRPPHFLIKHVLLESLTLVNLDPAREVYTETMPLPWHPRTPKALKVLRCVRMGL